MNFYSKVIMDLFHHTEHAGTFAPGTKNITTVQVGRPGQSDVLRMSVIITNNKITDVRFKTNGTITTIAAAEYLAQNIIGLEKNMLTKLDSQTINNALQLPARRFNAALLAEKTLQAIIEKINKYDC